MEAQIAILAMRTALGLLALVRNFTKNAGKEALQEFVEGVHATGGSIDADLLRGVQDDVKASGVDLDAAIAAAKAGG